MSPQERADAWWNPHDLDALLDDLVARYRVDEDRVYVTGLSIGRLRGRGGLIALNPDRFAAAAPICGGGTPRLMCQAGRLPVWAFHGAEDDVVPLRRSEEMVEALDACGGDVRLSVYPGIGHDSWTRTYADPELYDWLLQHRRSDRD